MKSRYKNKLSVFLCGVLLLWLCGCMTEEKCRQIMEYNSNIEFNLVIEGPTTAEPNYYEMNAKDLILNRSGRAKVDRGLGSIVPNWSIGDTLTKSKGNSIVILKKKKPILGTRIFVSEWTCNGSFINGEPL